jgi:hypothetical protein
VLAPLLESALWPVVSIMLLAPQRRAPDPDEPSAMTPTLVNRPPEGAIDGPDHDELRNVEADLSRFRVRILVASIVVVLAFLLLASRLVYLQVVRHDDLDEQAEANRTAIVPIVPNRGLILDRNGIMLATNYSAYTLEITPSRLAAPLEKTIDDLAQVIDIQLRDRGAFASCWTSRAALSRCPYAPD